MTNHQDVMKLAKECNKYFENKSKDGKLSLDYKEFYGWTIWLCLWGE